MLLRCVTNEMRNFDQILLLFLNKTDCIGSIAEERSILRLSE